MKYMRWVLIWGLAAVLVACNSTQSATPTPVAALPAETVGGLPSAGGVTASGIVAPAQEAQLAFTLAGRVQSVTGAVGAQVQPGAVLVTLDTTALEAEVARLEAALGAVQAQLALLQAGPRPAEIAAAQAQVDAAAAAVEGATARADQLAAGATAAEIAAAQAGVNAAAAAVSQAAARRDQLASGAIEAEMAAAQAQVAAAQAEQRQALVAHDRTMKCYSSPDGGRICPLLGTAEEGARYALNAADGALAAAQAQLDALTAGSADREREAVAAVAAAVAGRDAAQAQLDALTAGSADREREAEAAVAVAVAQRDAAQAQLDLLQAGPMPEQIAAAEAAVAQGEAALESARAALEQADLRAPFGGTVTTLGTGPGETVLPGQVVLVLADLRGLQVKTTDLSERDVADVAAGQSANLFVEALGTEVMGRVAQIAPQATTVGGDVVYEVLIVLDEQPAGLRWGMSVEVEITTE